MVDNVRCVLNNLIASWDISHSEKDEELKDTKIMFAGWSWKFKRFDIGFFKYHNGAFDFHHEKTRIAHPWKEAKRSLVFIGNYEAEFHAALADVLERRHGKQPMNARKLINFDYEPIEALALMLRKNAKDKTLPSIGGAPQLLKIYAHGNDLPIVIRIATNQHFLLGRLLFDWEKTGYPILDMRDDTPSFLYPMGAIPLPAYLHNTFEVKNDDIADIESQSDF